MKCHKSFIVSIPNKQTNKPTKPGVLFCVPNENDVWACVVCGLVNTPALPVCGPFLFTT